MIVACIICAPFLGYAIVCAMLWIGGIVTDTAPGEYDKRESGEA